jgi:hypothetical protein
MKSDEIRRSLVRLGQALSAGDLRAIKLPACRCLQEGPLPGTQDKLAACRTFSEEKENGY